jgi:hypothetical protein
MHALLALLAAFPSVQRAEPPPLVDPALLDLLHEELSGELAKEHVIAITRFHRIQASREYREAAEYVLDRLRAYGFGDEDGWIESFPSDGKVRYQTWQSPSGWDVDSAELRMVAPRAERLAAFPEIAMSLVTYSNAGEAAAELVDVGSGTRAEDYAAKDVRGKFVLATGYGGDVHRLAVLAHGAAAVVCWLDDERAIEHPDMVAYTGMWPRPDELERTTFGFNLSHRQGRMLRNMLARGETVRLAGRVEGTGLEPFFLDVVSARIPGASRPDEELVFSAHLDHPKESANDNASGSAAILDIARALRALIDAGRLPRPERTLRFLWVPEWYGTMAWIDAHPEMRGPALGGSVLANLNLDMVGEDLEATDSRLIVTRTPDSLPSAFNDVVAEVLEQVDRLDVRTPRRSRAPWNWRVTPYSGGSDHMMFLDRKVPAMMFTHDPDWTHHTSEDTPDKVDPVELERCELVAAASLWYLASLDEQQALDVVSLVASAAGQRLGEEGRRMQALARSRDELEAAGAVYDAHRLWLPRAAERERAALASVRSFHDSDSVGVQVARVQTLLEAQTKSLQESLVEHFLVAEGLRVPPMLEGVLVDSVPRPMRTTRGPLDFSLPERELPAARAEWYRSPGFPFTPDMRFELVNFVDGETGALGIRHRLSAEFGPVEIGDVQRYLEDLVSIDALAWKSAAETPPAPEEPR